MVKVRYSGGQISRRVVNTVDLGSDTNEDGSSDQLVWDKSNNFVVEMTQEMFDVLRTKGAGFSIVSNEELEGEEPAVEDPLEGVVEGGDELRPPEVVEDEDVDDEIDDQASDPDGPEGEQD